MIQLDKKFKKEYGSAIYGLAIIGLLVCVVLASLILRGAKETMSEGGYDTLQTALNLVFQLSNVLVFIVFLGKTKSKPDIFINHKIKPFLYALGFGFGLVSIFCFVGIAECGQVLLKKIGFALQPEYARGLPVKNVFFLLVTVLFAPIAEELIFRGALLSSLRRKFSPVVSALLCAAAFSLMHMNPEQTIYQFCLGFGASMLAISAGSVIPAIIMHATSNLIAAMSILGVGGFTHFFDFYSRVFMSNTFIFSISSILFALLGAALFVGVHLLIKKMSPPAQVVVDDDEDFLKEEQPSHLRAVRTKKVFKYKNKMLMFYFFTLGLTLLMWVSVLVSGI